MRFDPDPRLRQELIDRLRRKYLTEKPAPHLTELLYCLTKSFFDRVDPLEPTDTELLYFAVGFGLEAVILRDNGGDIESEEMDEIWLTPDYIDLQDTGLDLKSTRMYADESGIPKRGWPETWLQQFMAYARLPMFADSMSSGTIPYGVGIIFIGQPALGAGTFTFTREEIEKNWDYVLKRKGVYVEAIFTATPPEAYRYTSVDDTGNPTDWECKNCRYAMRCAAVAVGRAVNEHER